MTILRPETIEIVKKIQSQYRALAPHVERMARSLQPALSQLPRIAVTVSPIVRHMNEIMQRPGFKVFVKNMQFKQACEDLNIIPNPILLEIFGDELNLNSLQERWSDIRKIFWEKRPRTLMLKGREKRFEEFLCAQDQQLYTCVCRSVYPEIEKIIREAIVSTETFQDRYLEKDTEKARRSFVQSKTREAINIETSPFFDLNQPWSMDCFYTMEFYQSLEETFKQFDPQEVNENETMLNNNRHYHAHGWSDQTDFIDGLNALLLLDYAMEFFSEAISNNATET